MKLSRKWARIVCVLLALAVAFAVLPMAAYHLTGARSPDWAVAGVLGAVGFLSAGVVLRLKHLRCPYCGRSAAIPQWRTGKRLYCPCCDRALFYDDESDEEGGS